MQRRILGVGLLLLLLLRAYVPLGFMPSSSGFLALEICPEGLPHHALHHLHHGAGQSHDQFEHCPFGSVPAAGPAPHCVSLPQLAQITADVVRESILAAPEERHERANPPRGPPFLS